LQDGEHNSSTGVQIKVQDVQNTPPVFEGSLSGVVREDADIGTPVMTIKAHDGDKEHPRKVVYELVESELFAGSVITLHFHVLCTHCVK
jgi:hypothetical protein